MARMRVKLNHAGVAALLKSGPLQALVNAAAESTAGNVRSQGIRVGDKDGGSREVDLPVTVTSTVTDRAKATVTIAHPAGLSVQGKHGVLTKAAAAAGLEVSASG